MKKVTFIEAEQIGFEEIDKDLVAIKMADEKFMINMDTLYDLAFRCASFLAYLENREQQDAAGSEMLEGCNECGENLSSKSNSVLH